MRVRIRAAAQILEATDGLGLGLDRDELLASVALDPSCLADPRATIEWDTLAALVDRVFVALGREPEQMRRIGRALARAPSYTSFQRLARAMFSIHSLYEAATRWLAPATFPHLPLELTKLSETHLRFVGSIPEPHAPSVAFLHLFEGVLIETPTLLGLRCANIVESRITPRTLHTVIELPPSMSIGSRARRAFRAALYSGDALDLLEGQRRELMEGLVAVQRSTGEIHELFDGLPELVVLHRNGVIVWKNRAVVKLLGYEGHDDLVGRPLLDLVELGSRELVVSRMSTDDVAAMPELIEAGLLTRTGQVVVIEASPTQLVSFDGRPARLVVGRDVTERTRLRQQLMIADRMASVGMLAAGVAHEVNNPLGYVLNNVEMAIKELVPLGEATQQSRAFLGIALEGVDRIRTIVRDLLALSRVEDVEVGPVDVRAVVESTLALAGKEIAERARLVVELRPVGPVDGSVARLGQVLLNLITNALEAMPAGESATNQLLVRVDGTSTGGAVVEVSDNGAGIRAEDAPRIFDPFFTTKAPGTGLGLAISQRLVTEMGGRLSFESSERGTTFRIELAAAGTSVTPAH